MDSVIKFDIEKYCLVKQSRFEEYFHLAHFLIRLIPILKANKA